MVPRLTDLAGVVRDAAGSSDPPYTFAAQGDWVTRLMLLALNVSLRVDPLSGKAHRRRSSGWFSRWKMITAAGRTLRWRRAERSACRHTGPSLCPRYAPSHRTGAIAGVSFLVGATFMAASPQVRVLSPH